MNTRFINAIAKNPQAVPPIWFMRQAGRYHKHYQALRAKHGFMELCKHPDLAAKAAMGPIEDFDFDVAILFSDLLFPLEALGFGLAYDPGPKLDQKLTFEFLKNVPTTAEAVEKLAFQKDAVELTREFLPRDKSLIGFVGGPWTLFSYAVGGSHDGNLIAAKTQKSLYEEFLRHMIPLLKENIKLQLEGGAEVIMLFDTAAGELSPSYFKNYVASALTELARTFPGKLGYYSKGTQRSHFADFLTDRNWAGHGVDHRNDLASLLKKRERGFLQGNFDQALLFCESKEFKNHLLTWLGPFRDLSESERGGWVCGLGHGVLPATPENNVRNFVEIVRKELSR